MKKILCTSLIVIFTISLVFSQSNALEKLDSVAYVTPIEEAFMIDRESKFLLKINPSKPSSPGAIPRSQQLLHFEYKLSNAISISSKFSFGHYSRKQQYPNPKYTFTAMSGGLEARYYLGMAKRIKSNEQANNLSGNYLATSVAYSEAFGSFLRSDIIAWNYAISYGIQRRFLNFGFLDYAFSLGMSSNISAPTTLFPSRQYQNYSISSSMNAGIAFGKNYKLGEDATCPIFKCHTDRRMAFKINLNKTFNIRATEYKISTGNSNLLWGVTFNPNIIFENKVATSSFSLEQDLDASLLLNGFISSNNNISNSVSFDYAIKYRSSIKYYHLQKKNIRSGKSGNNLSGLYIFGRGEFQEKQGLFKDETSSSPGSLKEVRERDIALQAGYGYQKEVLNNLFFDLSAGLTKNVFANYNRPLEGIGVVADIKVGLMF